MLWSAMCVLIDNEQGFWAVDDTYVLEIIYIKQEFDMNE